MKMRFEIRYALGVLLFFGTPLFALTPENSPAQKRRDQASSAFHSRTQSALDKQKQWAWRSHPNLAILAAGVGVATAAYGFKDVVEQRKAAMKRAQGNEKRKAQGEELLPEKAWFWKRWLKKGKALFGRVKKSR